MLATFGAGGARVDLVLPNNSYYLGDTVVGEIHVYGGDQPVRIRKVDVLLMMEIMIRNEKHTKPVTVIPSHSSFEVKSGDCISFPFQFQLPRELLISSETVSYFFATELDVADGVTYTDRDPISILPPEGLQNVIQAYGLLGFRETENSRKFNGYAQEFEFYPTTLFRDQVREMRLTGAIEKDGIRLWIELDLYSNDMASNVQHEIWLEPQMVEQLSQMAAHLEQFIDKAIQTCMTKEKDEPEVPPTPSISFSQFQPFHPLSNQANDACTSQDMTYSSMREFELTGNWMYDLESSSQKQQTSSKKGKSYLKQSKYHQKTKSHPAKKGIGAVGAFAAGIFSGAILEQIFDEEEGIGSVIEDLFS